MIRSEPDRGPVGIEFLLNRDQILTDLKSESSAIPTAIAPTIQPESWRIALASGAAIGDQNCTRFRLNRDQNPIAIGPDSDIDSTAIEF